MGPSPLPLPLSLSGLGLGTRASCVHSDGNQDCPAGVTAISAALALQVCRLAPCSSDWLLNLSQLSPNPTRQVGGGVFLATPFARTPGCLGTGAARITNGNAFLSGATANLLGWQPLDCSQHNSGVSISRGECVGGCLEWQEEKGELQPHHHAGEKVPAAKLLFPRPAPAHGVRLPASLQFPSRRKKAATESRHQDLHDPRAAKSSCTVPATAKPYNLAARPRTRATSHFVWG